MPPLILTYLNNLYNSWRNNPQFLFSDPNGFNIPIDQLGLAGYSTICPPVPWMGNINNINSLALISLEPKLNPANFWEQVENSQTFNNWVNTYFANYFPFTLPNIVRLQGYWNYLANLAKGFGNNPGCNNVTALSDYLIEFPFCQYHAANHPGGNVTHNQIDQLITSLNFFANGRNRIKVLVLGRDICNEIIHNFPTVLIDPNALLGAPAICRGNQFPLEVRDLIVNGITYRLFLRYAPFSNSMQPSFPGCFLIGQIIYNYP